MPDIIYLATPLDMEDITVLTFPLDKMLILHLILFTIVFIIGIIVNLSGERTK